MGIFDLFKKKEPKVKEEKDMNELDSLLKEVNQIKADLSPPKPTHEGVEKPTPQAPKKKVGRPKGSKNKPKPVPKEWNESAFKGEDENPMDVKVPEGVKAQNLMSIVGNQVVEFNIEDSQVHGKGMIAKSNIPKDAILSETHQLGVDGGFDPIFPFGFFVNHSVSNANAFLATFVDKLYIITTREIPKGSEILIDYRERPDLEQPNDDWNK